MWKTFLYLDEHGNKIRHLQVERKEQILAQEYILPSDCVLELGARYGTVSCATNAILSCKTDHVVVEPDSRVWNALEENRDRNGMKFHIVRGFCSRKQLCLYDFDNWNGYGTKSQEDEHSEIPSYPLEELQQITTKPFTALIADCEGYLETFLNENPTFLQTLRCIIFEKDNPQECNYGRIKRQLRALGFEQKVSLFREVWTREIEN